VSGSFLGCVNLHGTPALNLSVTPLNLARVSGAAPKQKQDRQYRKGHTEKPQQNPTKFAGLFFFN